MIRSCVPRRKIVIDTYNYYPPRDRHIPELDDESTTTTFDAGRCACEVQPFTKQELLDEMTRRGLKTRKGLPVSSQAFSTMLQNKLYVSIVEARGYGVVGKRGDFDPLIPEDLCYACSQCRRVAAHHGATAAGAPGLPISRVRTLRVMWSWPHWQLVEGPNPVTFRSDESQRLGPNQISDSARSGWP